MFRKQGYFSSCRYEPENTITRDRYTIMLSKMILENSEVHELLTDVYYFFINLSNLYFSGGVCFLKGRIRRQFS